VLRLRHIPHREAETWKGADLRIIPRLRERACLSEWWGCSAPASLPRIKQGLGTPGCFVPRSVATPCVPHGARARGWAGSAMGVAANLRGRVGSASGGASSLCPFTLVLKRPQPIRA
jgi:hypothetical protein